jgi:hypothetical protein
MLQADRVAAVPELTHSHVRPKVINMPVRPLGSPQVVCDPRTQASRSERAPDVDIISRPKPHRSESSHPDCPSHRAAQDERVGSRFSRHIW